MSALTPAQQAWVDALRSGDYKQGECYLRDESDHYCCLGVACDVARKHGVEVDVTRSVDGHYQYDGASSFPPPAVVNWLGLRTDIGAFNPGTVENAPAGTLYSLNDNWKWSFEEIADAIERAQDLFVDTPEEPTPEEPEAKPESEIEF